MLDEEFPISDSVLIAGFVIAAVFAITATVITLYLAVQHLRNYTEPHLQRSIVRILLIVPIYAVASWLSLVFHEQALYFELVRGCYESYVIYVFFKLLVEFLGGEDRLLALFNTKPKRHHPPPCCCISYTPDGTFYQRCLQSMLQFVIIRPLSVLAALVLEFFHLYDEGNFSPERGYLYLTIIDNVSFTWALYYLVLFYEVTKTDLAPYKPLAKFMVIKSVIFFSYWQGIIIAMGLYFSWIPGGDVFAGQLQGFLICIEMVIIAWMFALSFGVNNYKTSTGDIEIHDLREKRGVLENIASVASMRDVINDTVESFKSAKMYVDVGDFGSVSVDEKVKRTVKHGLLQKRDKDMFKKWHSFYFFLINKPAGLVYYTDNPFDAPDQFTAFSKPKGFINFQHLSKMSHVDHEGDEISLKENNSFIILTTVKPGESEPRRWHLMADVNETADWFSLIEKIVGQLDKHVPITSEDDMSPVGSPNVNNYNVNNNMRVGSTSILDDDDDDDLMLS